MRRLHRFSVVTGRREKGMRTMIAAVTGIFGGFIIGVLLSSVIGILSFQFFFKPFGIPFFPYLCALAGAVAVPVIDWRQWKHRHSSKNEWADNG
jgi:hypothetical protein